MSNISTIYDFLKAQIALALPNHSTFLDPNSIEMEDENRFEKCFGITIGPTTMTQHSNLDIAFNREFHVTIVRKNYSIRTLSEDREAVEKYLMEDQLLVIERLLNLTRFNVSYPYIQRISIVADGGIEFFAPEHPTLLSVRSTFEILYHEVSN